MTCSGSISARSVPPYTSGSGWLFIRRCTIKWRVEVAACRFEITKEYADDPETYVMNKGELRITDLGRILFGKNRGYNQKGKSERQFKTLLQDYAQLTFSSTNLTGDFQTIQGSKESRPVIVSMMAQWTHGSYAYAFNYEGRGLAKSSSRTALNIAAQNIATRSKGTKRESGRCCYTADAISAGAKDLPTPDELTKLIKAVVDSSAAKVSKLALRRFGLRKDDHHRSWRRPAYVAELQRNQCGIL